MTTAKRKAKSSAAAKRRTSRKKSAPVPAIQSAPCPIVGIGGSAGGFEAAMELLRHLPPKNGMAYVIVQHLDPHYESRLAGLLGRATEMPVVELKKPVTPEANTVYVLPPNKCVTLDKGRLTLARRTNHLNLAIDHFFESLAESQGTRAIGVVLSGTGSDGTGGLRAIKAAGGITFAQDEQSAKFGSMPRNAVKSGFVDAVLAPREIAEEIFRIGDHPYIQSAGNDGAGSEESRAHQAQLDDMERIFLSLKKHTGVDFSSYKQSTLQRRIHRRMALQRMEELGKYARFLRDNKDELEGLFNDLLISVTRFFRDEDAFKALKKRFFPALIKGKSRHAELRVWVPGCATGEEVYSLAICLLETLGKNAGERPMQIFGTDLSESAINRARTAVYSTAIEKDVSPERLRRFFEKSDGTYRIKRPVRDLCTFARQNMSADPPFSRMDFISCRNVLIYLGQALQKRCLPIFHYALNPGGYLMLGPSETVGIFSDLFELVDKRNKIYAKKVLPARLDVAFQNYGASELKSLQPAAPAPPSEGGKDFNGQVQATADRILLGSYAPGGVVIDSQMQVRFFRGRTAPYLEHGAGPATLNLLHMARPSLVPELRAAVHQALRSEQPVRKERVTVRYDGLSDEVNIEVVPFQMTTSDVQWLLIIFEPVGKDAAADGKPRKTKARPAKENELTQLQEELNATKESLQSIIEEQEATNEELKSANEEIESSNEELQSTNEELETAKEELQSTNEELTTLNEELSNRNLEMILVNSDLNNLLSSVHIPILMVDNALKVRRATPTARELFNILESDIGRPLSELRSNIDVPDLDKLLRGVIADLSICERQVRDLAGAAYSLRIRPYRTSEDKIDGAVITLIKMQNGNRGKGKTGPRVNRVKARARKT